MAVLESLLRRAVDAEGRVRYGDVDEQQVQETLDEVAGADLASLSGADRYAFLLNAYNAWALALAHRLLWTRGKPGLSAPWRWLRFFLLAPVRVGGKTTNLLLLEFWLLRRHLKRDPRGHFALVCASQGCPPLRGGAYHAEHLDEELERAGRSWMRPGVGYHLDRERGVLHASRILRWYAADFRRLGGTRGVVARYAEAHAPDDAAWIRQHRPRVRFLRYDWRLNAAPKATAP